MSAIGEVRAAIECLRAEGSLRSHVPPAQAEECFNPAAERMPRAQLTELRDSRIRQIVQWAYRNVPFYHRLWEGAGVHPDQVRGYADLEKLPIFRKDAIRAVETEQPPFGDIVAPELIPHVERLFFSTGTTGESTAHVWIPDEYQLRAEIWSRYFWAQGCRPGGVYVEFLPLSGGLLPPVLFPMSARDMGMVHYHEDLTRFFGQPDQSAQRLLKLAQAYKPLSVIMTPEFQVSLGKQFEKMGVPSPVDVCGCMGAPLSERLRREVHALHPRAAVPHQMIGMTEGPCCFECSHSAERGLNHMHEQEDMFVLEAVDPDTGLRVPEGQRGELIMTCFFRYTQPLIRFSTEDLFDNAVITDPCACGRTTRRWLHPVSGRVRDQFTVTGKSLMPWDVEAVVADIPGTTMIFQVHLYDWDMPSLQVKVEVTDGHQDAGKAQSIRQALSRRLGVPVEAELVEAGAIRPPAGGFKIPKVVDSRPKRTMPA